ncbi:FadR/GntR family transcriptional regulator [Geodermatophilus sp. SYSU D00697]
MQSSDQSRSGRRYLVVAQTLLTQITSGEYVAGDRLPADRSIAETFGVSRATAREAQLALEVIGAVEVRHGDGVYVRWPPAQVGGVDGSPLDAPPRELIESRRSIEPVVAGLAATRIDSDTLAGLRRNLDEAAELVDDDAALPRFMAVGLQFHADLAPGCGNSLLADIVAQLVNAETHPLWTLVNQQAMRTREARLGQLREHRDVVAAIAAGDTSRAERAMSAHLRALDTAIFRPLAATVTAS